MRRSRDRWSRHGYPAGDKPASQLKPPPEHLTSQQGFPSRLAEPRVKSGTRPVYPTIPERPSWDQTYHLIQLSRANPRLSAPEVLDLWQQLRVSHYEAQLAAHTEALRAENE